MKILDTNILIYAAEEPYKKILASYVTNPANGVSSISQVEALGFWKITPEQIKWFNSIFTVLRVFPVDGSVIEIANSIRQKANVRLGDALIAATCLN